MSREAWMIFCTNGEQSQNPVVATNENAMYLCAGKPLEYFLRGKKDLVHKLGKAVRLEIIGYQHKYAEPGEEIPPRDFVIEKMNEDDNGEITYVHAGGIKPVLQDFNQYHDGLAAKYIQELPDDTVIILLWH